MNSFFNYGANPSFYGETASYNNPATPYSVIENFLKDNEYEDLEILENLPSENQATLASFLMKEEVSLSHKRYMVIACKIGSDAEIPLEALENLFSSIQTLREEVLQSSSLIKDRVLLEEMIKKAHHTLPADTSKLFVKGNYKLFFEYVDAEVKFFISKTRPEPRSPLRENIALRLDKTSLLVSFMQALKEGELSFDQLERARVENCYLDLPCFRTLREELEKYEVQCKKKPSSLKKYLALRVGAYFDRAEMRGYSMPYSRSDIISSTLHLDKTHTDSLVSALKKVTSRYKEEFLDAVYQWSRDEKKERLIRDFKGTFFEGVISPLKAFCIDMIYLHKEGATKKQKEVMLLVAAIASYRSSSEDPSIEEDAIEREKDGLKNLFPLIKELSLEKTENLEVYLREQAPQNIELPFIYKMIKQDAIPQPKVEEVGQEDLTQRVEEYRKAISRSMINDYAISLEEVDHAEEELKKLNKEELEALKTVFDAHPDKDDPYYEIEGSNLYLALELIKFCHNKKQKLPKDLLEQIIYLPRRSVIKLIKTWRESADKQLDSLRQEVQKQIDEDYSKRSVRIGLPLGHTISDSERMSFEKRVLALDVEYQRLLRPYIEKENTSFLHKKYMLAVCEIYPKKSLFVKPLSEIETLLESISQMYRPLDPKEYSELEDSLKKLDIEEQLKGTRNDLGQIALLQNKQDQAFLLETCLKRLFSKENIPIPQFLKENEKARTLGIALQQKMRVGGEVKPSEVMCCGLWLHHLLQKRPFQAMEVIDEAIKTFEKENKRAVKPAHIFIALGLAYNHMLNKAKHAEEIASLQEILPVLFSLQTDISIWEIRELVADMNVNRQKEIREKEERLLISNSPVTESLIASYCRTVELRNSYPYSKYIEWIYSLDFSSIKWISRHTGQFFLDSNLLLLMACKIANEKAKDIPLSQKERENNLDKILQEIGRFISSSKVHDLFSEMYWFQGYLNRAKNDPEKRKKIIEEMESEFKETLKQIKQENKARAHTAVKQEAFLDSAEYKKALEKCKERKSPGYEKLITLVFENKNILFTDPKEIDGFIDQILKVHWSILPAVFKAFKQKIEKANGQKISLDTYKEWLGFQAIPERVEFTLKEQYEVFGFTYQDFVSLTYAEADEKLKPIYRKLMFQYHPDKLGVLKEGEIEKDMESKYKEYAAKYVQCITQARTNILENCPEGFK